MGCASRRGRNNMLCEKTWLTHGMAVVMKWTPAENRLFSYLAEISPRYNKRKTNSPAIIRYGAAACIMAAAWAVSEFEIDILFGTPSFEALYFGMMLAARVLGKGPAWFCAVLSLLFICWVLPPDESLAVYRDQLPRAASNAAALCATLLMWPAAGFGDWFYRVPALHRRAIASIVRQNSSSSSSIGRPRAASRSITMS